jgi:hypothetical protein
LPVKAPTIPLKREAAFAEAVKPTRIVRAILETFILKYFECFDVFGQ